MKNNISIVLIAIAMGLAFLSCSNQQKTTPAQSDEEQPVVRTVDEDYIVGPEDEVAEEEHFALKAVDLGLSVLWANANIGSNDIYESGEYFAWGESSPKSSYTLDNYFDYYIEVKEGGFIYRGYKIFTKGGQSLIGTEYDTAHNLLGEGWRMPTPQEYIELIKKCKLVKKYFKDNNKVIKDYVEVTGPNGNSIILPYTGYKSADEFDKRYGYYWTANMPIRGSDDKYAMAIGLADYGSVPMATVAKNKGYGLCVRAVKDKDASTATIADGVYNMEGMLNPASVNDFRLKIEGAQVSGKYLLATGSFNGVIEFEGTKDEHNNISLKETYRGEDIGRMEGVFDGKTFRGTEYDTDGDGEEHAFKFIVKE